MLISLPKYLTAKYTNHQCEAIESFENTYKNDLIACDISFYVTFCSYDIYILLIVVIFRVKKQNINEVAVNSKKITTFIIRMYLHDLLVERCNYALKEENPKFPSINEDITAVCLVRKRRSHEEEKLHLEQKLLSKILIVDQDDIFDKFCLLGSLEEIINLLIECSNGLAFSSQPKVTFNSIAKQYIVNDAIWFNPKTYQTCAGWVINEFEKAIALIYYQQQQGQVIESTLFQNEDIKKFWNQDQELRGKILNQAPQICKEFKNAPKKKAAKQEDILWAQIIIKKILNQQQPSQDKLTLNIINQIQEEEINQIFSNNDFENIYYLPLEKIVYIQSLCEKRLLRMIRDHFKEKLMKDLQEIEGKERDKKKILDQKKKSKKQGKKKNKVDHEKNQNINSEKHNTSIPFDKQDTTQEDIKCSEYEQNLILQSQSNEVLNESKDEIKASAEELLQPNETKEDASPQVFIAENIKIDDQAKNQQQIKDDEQNKDDDESWVMIVAPKKQKKKVQRKFASSNDLSINKKLPVNKQIKPTTTTTTPTIQVQKNNQIIKQFQYQEKDLKETENDSFSNRNSLKQSSQDNSSEKTLTPEKKEIKSPQSDSKIERNNFTKSLEMNQQQQEIKEEPIIKKQMSQVIQLKELSLNQNDYLDNNQNYEFNKTGCYQEYDNHCMSQTDDEIDPIIMNQARGLMIKKLDMDMREFNDIMLQQNQEMLQIRKLIYDRLQFVINYLFREFNSSVRLFGSCATGLALPESDLDIGVTGFELYPVSQLNGPIQNIIDFLQKMKWITSIKAITTSSMPLIKLQVDPTISFTDSTHQMVLPYIDLIPNSEWEIPKKILSVDISFFQYQGSKTQQHLGQISTEMTITWLQFYNELRPIVLLFKSLLKKRGLNEQYKGGISSFCIIQMVLAFLERCYQQNQASSIGYTTYQFLKYFGTEFNPQTTGIYYKGFNQDPFYELNEYDDQLQITIVSPINNDVISQASSFVQTILQDIKTLYLATENEVIFFYEKLKYNKKKKGKKEERNLFQKELNKLRPLFSTTVYNKT